VIVECGEDRPGDAIQIGQDVVVTEPDDSIAMSVQPSGSRRVLLAIRIVLPAIDLDDQPFR
jgi:hypothetical protein